jgi:hypothetical protein
MWAFSEETALLARYTVIVCVQAVRVGRVGVELCLSLCLGREVRAVKVSAAVGASLVSANLSDSNLSHANLTSAVVAGADLSGANLEGAKVNDALLWSLQHQTSSIEGATMPNGQKYEDWLKSKGSEEDEKNAGPS